MKVIVIDTGDVIIDFSTRETSLEVLSLAVKHQKALVCGTTGFSPEELQQFQDATTLIPMLYTANTSKLVKYKEQASGTGHFHTKKECASAHSRAERGRLRHSSSSCKCASPARSAFCFIGSSFGISYEIKKNWRHFLSCRQFLICSTIFDYNCSDACASIFLFVLILVHLFLLIDLFLSHFTNLLFFSSEGRYLRSMTPQTPLQLHFH